MRSLTSKLTLIVSACSALSGIACSGTDSGTPVSSGGVLGAGGLSSGGTVNTGGVATGGNAQAGATAATGGTTTGGALNTGGFGAAGGTTTTAGGAATGGAATGGAATGGALSGGTASTGGSKAPGGATSTGGSKATGGTISAGGVLTTGGSKAVGGTSSTGGSKAVGGTPSTGGSNATGGGTSVTCGATPNPNPFGCSFAWGTNGANPTTVSYLQFISNWAGYNIQANGTFSSFDASGWLRTMSTATQVPAYYAYLLGYYGHANGLPDGNVDPNGPNLGNGMGTLLLGVDNAACPQGPPATICADHLMVKAYAWYAAQTYGAYKKPIIWLLEGDLIQYSPSSSQTQKLTWTQFGQLVAQIVLAIKCNDPPAVVAVNYSSWMTNATMQLFFGAINTEVANLGTSYEMVWTTGQGTSANAGTGTTWAQLHTASGGKPILVDESFGLSAASDTWANQSAATINSRIAGGVQAINITTSPLPSYFQTNATTTLAPSALNSTCL